MSVKVASNRLIVSSLKRYAGFYQQLLRSVSGFDEVGKRLIHLAESARVLRQTEQVGEAGQILSNFPLREYQTIGQYYLGVCEFRRQDRELERIRPIFEQVAETSSLSSYYRARAMLSLAAIAASTGDYATELYYGLEATKVSSGFSIQIEALKGIAVIKAKEGDHRRALKETEALLPLLRYVDPVTYYDCLNSLAVELCEAGRLEEARNISNIVLASPYVFAYPEWRETSDDIERKGYRQSRSFVPIIQGLQHNIIRLPERENIPVSQSEPARILHYDWKNRMVKEPNGDQTDDTSLDEMTNKDLIIEIVQRTSNKDMSENKLRKILEYVMQVESEPED